MASATFEPRSSAVPVAPDPASSTISSLAYTAAGSARYGSTPFSHRFDPSVRRPRRSDDFRSRIGSKFAASSTAGKARQAAMSALAMSRSAAVLPVLENLFETMPTNDLKRRALSGIGRNDNADAAATYLIRVSESEKDMELRKSAIASLGRIAGQKSLGALTGTVDGDADIELQKQAVVAIGRRPKDEAIPILIRTARNHPKMPIRKVAIQMLGQTGDERAVAFFRELLSKD